MPAYIIGGEVNPSGAAGNDDENSNQDGWVPFGWTDEAQGTDAKLSYEYCSHRDYVRSSNDDNSSEEEATGGHWGSFSAPTIWSHYGHDAATYIIRATTGSITIASNATSAVLNTTLSFYRRENNTESAYSCYTCAFLKSGNTYTRITNTSSYPVYSSKRDSAALTYECTAAHDSIVVCIYATPSTSHNEYLAELELPIRKNGDTGGRGQSVYSLQTSVAAIKFTKNFAGVPTPNPSSFSISLQYEGLSIALPDGYGVYRRYPQGIWSSDSLGTKASNTIFSNGNYTAVEFALCSGNPNSQGSIIVSRVTVTAAWEYQRILLPAGIWENKEYTRSSTATPLVYHMGSYYYLVSDTSYVGGVYVEPGTNNNVWELADQFEVVLAKMLMADYGKIASAVFYGDHMFSQYLANETNMFSGSFTRAEEAYIIVPGQSSLSVVVGTQYKIRVTCRSNTSYTNGFFANVFYLSSEYDDTDANWSKYALAGKEKTFTNNGTSGIYNISFTSEYTGYARIYVYGYGTITKITSSISSGYDKVSPMFVNTDKVPLLVTWNNSTVSTSFTNIVYTPVPLVAGRTYALTFNAYIEGGGGYVGVYYNGSIRHSLYIDNTSEAGKTLVLTASDTTEAYIMFRTANASYRIHVNSVYIRCTNAFVPKVDVNWLTGYAHFSGDNVRFNPDGSGWLAGKNVTWEADGSGTLAAGNISWNAEGDASFRGTVHATSGEFEGTVRAHAFSSNTKMIGYTELYGEEDYIVDMENNPYVLFTAKGTYAVVTLPDPQLYEGLELQFFHIPGTRMSIGRIRFASVIYSIEEEEDGYIVEKHWTDAVASRGILVKVQALGGVWRLTSGKLEHATY